MKNNNACFTGMNGAFAAMFTPFTPDDEIDDKTIARMVEYGLANGLAGFYLTGSTGEWFLLSSEERKTLWRHVVKAVDGRAKVIAHVGSTSTAESVALAKAAAEIGVDWISSIAPPVFCNDFDRIFCHYRKISEATELPFMIYSIGRELVPERELRFFDLPNVKGMKYTGRDYFAAQALKRDLDRSGKETVFFAGCDEQLLCALALDGVFSGGIGTTYNIIPGYFSKICALAAQNDFKAAAVLQDKANEVIRLMIESGNWSYRKAMMKFIGIDCGAYRAPYEPLSPKAESEFFARFAAIGAIDKDAAAGF